MRVYERGCGITLACGTGACATVVAGVLNNLTENKVKVNLLGGAVIIEWRGSAQNLSEHVFMTGRADYSFFGGLHIVIVFVFMLLLPYRLNNKGEKYENL